MNNDNGLNLIPCERCDELIPFDEYQTHGYSDGYLDAITNNCLSRILKH